MKLTLFVVFLLSLALHDAQGSCWRRTSGGPPPPAGSPSQPKGRPTAPPTKPTAPSRPHPTQKTPLYRYWNPHWVDHFYTTNFNELAGRRGRHGFRYEGIQGYLYIKRVRGSVPLYRYWNPRSYDHFYTTNPREIGTTCPGKTGRHGYKSEGHMGFCMPRKVPGTVPLYRYWKAHRADHFYTTNIKEIGTATPGKVGRHGYTSEGITCYVFTRP